MITYKFENDKNRAVAYNGDKEVGECTFSPSDNVWIIDHTFVDSEYGGQGIARELVAKVVERAREANKKIIPLCSYAKKEFDIREEYRDLL